jgi:hypothetical protein
VVRETHLTKINILRCVFIHAFARARARATDEAAQYRQRVVHEVYPELGQYLSEDALQLLAFGLDCDVQDIWKFFGFRGSL